MATPTDSTRATFRAHHAAGVDPVLAHEASEELRNQAAINVITQFEARFDKSDARFDKSDARFDTIDARFDTIDTRFDKIEDQLSTFKNQHWVLLAIITTGVIGGLIALLFR